MYWWFKASQLVQNSGTQRFGFITTNSIVQGFNAAVVASAIDGGLHIVFAAPDHPWVDGAEGASVRVSMTVGSAKGAPSPGQLLVVAPDGELSRVATPRINADLTGGIDVFSAAKTPLRSNEGLSFRGVQPQGNGFVLDREEAERLRALPGYSAVVRPHFNGSDLVQRPRGAFIIDFGLEDLEFARRFPVALGLVVDRVKPDRDANRRSSYRDFWWRLGEPRRTMRTALIGLRGYFVTAETTPHRTFVQLSLDVSTDNSVVVLAIDDACLLGTLSSAVHGTWSRAAGTRLGVGNTWRYNNPLCFDAFPFPHCAPELASEISRVASRLDATRKDSLSRDERVTMTAMYNVIEKLRSGDPLTPAERTIHELAACGILRDLHDELDRLVAEAYGWPWPMEREEILERLVALHGERVEEEKRGLVRWLRPDYQIPRFAPVQAPATLALDHAPAAKTKRGKKAKTVEAALSPAPTKTPWPSTAVEQIAAITSFVAQQPRSAADITASFTGAQFALVARHLETLALMGEITLSADGRYHPVHRAA